MKRPLIIIISVVVVFLLVGTIFTSMLGGATFSSQNRGLGYGIGGSGGGAPEMPAATLAPAAEAPPVAMDAYGNVLSPDLARSASNAPAQPQERLVIVNADLAIVVKDPKVRMAEISKLAVDMGGYVVSSNLYQSYTAIGKEVPEASIVIRVPAPKLDEALGKIKEGAVDIQSENRSGQDVTDVYVDLQSRLKAKEAADKKLLEIMDQATKSEDVLAIYMQIQNVETEIEQLKGQIKYYEESAALSSVTVRLIAEESTQPLQVGPWKPEGSAKSAVEDLVRFMQNFADFLIRFVIFTLPALILIAIPLLLIFVAGRAVYRRVRKSKVVVEEKEIVKKD
jgi:hypothetical protein